MKYNKSLILVALASLTLLGVGCKKHTTDTPVSGEDVQLAFAPYGVNILPAQQLESTKAEAPMPLDAAFRVLIFDKDAAITGIDKAQNTYKVVAGNAIPTAVTSQGEINPLEVAPSQMILKAGSEYDFYYFSPALAFTNGSVSGLINGVDYMAVKQSHNVIMESDSKYHVVEVQLERLSTRIDVSFSPKAGETSVTSLSIDAAGVTISGLASSATYQLGQPALDVLNTHDGESVIPTSMFVAESATIATTQSDAKGVIILPLTERSVMLSAQLIINDVTTPIQVVVNHTFEAGYAYLFDLKVSSAGAVGVTVECQPWTESSYNENVTNEAYIGEYRSGGVIYWIDPIDSKHYKVLSCYQPQTKNQADAVAYSTGYGAGWHLPTTDEMNELYTSYIANQTAIDSEVARNNGIAIVDGDYWIDTTDADNAINLTTGETTAQIITEKLFVRAIKEVQE